MSITIPDRVIVFDYGEVISVSQSDADRAALELERRAIKDPLMLRQPILPGIVALMDAARARALPIALASMAAKIDKRISELAALAPPAIAVLLAKRSATQAVEPQGQGQEALQAAEPMRGFSQ